MPDVFHDLKGILDHRLATIGNKPITLFTILAVLLAVWALMAFARWSRVWLINRVLTHTHLDTGMRQTIGTLVNWAVLIFGFMLVMQTLGINLSALSVLAGALGVGVGFGLQNIFSNFISGLIVMMERPVRVGDRVEVGGMVGDVVSIGARSTTLVTASRSRIFVPNQSFITGNVVNWQSGGAHTALVIPMKIAPGPELQVLEQILLDAVSAADDAVFKDAPPRLDFLAWDAAGCSLQLTLWVVGDAETRARALTRANTAIYKALTSHQVKLA